MLNKVEYINLVTDSFSKFTQAGSYAQKIDKWGQSKFN